MLGVWDALGTPTVPGHHPHAPTAWQSFGTPNWRREDDITSTLMGANWTEVKVLAPPKYKKGWLIRAIPPSTCTGHLIGEVTGEHIFT